MRAGGLCRAYRETAAYNSHSLIKRNIWTCCLRETRVRLNGANVVRIQVVLATSMAIATITLKNTLVPWIAVAGIVWATVIGYTISLRHRLQ